MDVGIRELKARLSAYLEQVADEGVSLTITDRGVPKAMIVPISQEEDPLERGIREGWLTPGPLYRRGVPLPPPQTFQTRPGVSIMDIIDADRGN